LVEKESHHTPEQLRALVYRDRPYLFNGLRDTLSELQSIARTYGSLQKYDVTQNALVAIANLLAGYLRLRDGDLVMPSSYDALIGPTDFTFDTVLTETLEAISALHKTAIRSSDVQLSQQIIGALEYLALQGVNVQMLISRPDENPAVAFIGAFLFDPVQDAAMRGLDDITMAGARALTSAARALLKKRQFLTARGIVTDIEKLAYISIAQRKSPVTGTSVKGIAEILQLIMSEPLPEENVIRHVLEALQRVCEAELLFKSAPLDQNLRFSIGAFLDLTQPTALANVEALAIRGFHTATEEGNWTKANQFGRVIRELNDGLRDCLGSIGVAAAKTESFALFDINSNIAEIVMHCLWLISYLNRTQPEEVDEDSSRNRRLRDEFAADVERDLNWIVGATYRRIVESLVPPIRINLIWEFFPTLSRIGIRALNAHVPSVAESAISELKSISRKAIERPIEKLASAARIAAFIGRIGIVAQKLGVQEVLNASIAALKEFQELYFAKQRELKPDAEEYDMPLDNELRELKEDLGKGRGFLNEDDAAFFGKVTPEDIDRFIQRL